MPAVSGQTIRIEDAPAGTDDAPLIEPVQVADMLVDGLAGVQFINGIVRLLLYVERQDLTDGSTTRLVVGRLAMTPANAHVLAGGLGAVLARLTDHGTIPPLPKLTVQ